MEIKLPELDFAKFRFTLEALETLYLPEYKGSTLRGGFGHSFRKVVCTMGPIPCETCLLHLKCPYPQFFETPVVGEPPPFMRGVKTGPQPFVVEPPLETKRVYQKEEVLAFGLVLIGRAVEFLPYFIYTFDQLGIMGIGRSKGKFKLMEVTSLTPECHTIYNGDSKTLTADYSVMSTESCDTKKETIDRVTLKFLTPTRIKVNGHLIMEMPFRELVLTLLRRLHTLAHLHMPASVYEWQWRAILESAADVVIAQKNLHWCDWERYSNRQKTRMKLGGFLGEITYKGNLTDWLPLLTVGEFVHVGKGATFGLGKYEVNWN
ncbi:MAG: CRISPR system precrRNA processing endoribonuclease RAMP protein Cas6 [bacterium]